MAQPKFQPAGECIYCGETKGPLSNEHVIPYSLGGTLVLPKSSCASCGAVTSKFECVVTRGFAHQARLAGKFPSRKKKTQPSTISVRLLDENGDPYEVEVSKEAGLGVLILPELSLPTYLAGLPPSDLPTWTGFQDIWYGGTPPSEFALAQGAKAVQNPQVTIGPDFIRMLAKIAYSYGVGVTGQVDRDNSPLPDLILNGQGLGTWVGSERFEFPNEQYTDSQALVFYPGATSPNGPVDVVRMKLFGVAGMPFAYLAVTRAPGWQEAAR